jgi:hypothetical protein
LALGTWRISAYQIGLDGRIKSGVDLDCAEDAEGIEAADQLVGELTFKAA